MKVSEQWLRELANPPGNTAALAEQLTMAGLEVDGVEPCAPPSQGVVVGRVLEKSQHPNADRLSLCKVDIGAQEPVSIVCGAANVRAGGAYPVATIGAKLPGGLKIKRGKIRGEESFGMLCSAVELGLAESSEGLLELPADATAGAPVADLLGLDDQIIDIDLTPNRADCFSMLGVARDLAAINGLDFAPPVVVPVEVTGDTIAAIELQAEAACPAFAARVITGLNLAATTPLWLAERLRRAGIRPLHPIVDVTNYVMLEFGQPMHAYDLRKLQGTVVARFAKRGEKLTLLDGHDLKLGKDVLVIADNSGPVGMAGIMGGAATAVGDTTTEVLLESAFFAPAAIAGRARRYGLHTDASVRFERGVDFAGQVRALERATGLIIDIAGGTPGPVTDARAPAELPELPAVNLRRARLAQLLGIALPDAAVTAMLTRLGFTTAEVPDGWSVTPHSARFDISIEVDLIEEIARLHGYGNVPELRQLTPTALATATEARVPLGRCASLLADRGYCEAITYSFVDPGRQAELLGEAAELKLANPISADMAVMRRSLWPGLLGVLELNRNRQQDRVRIFERGVIFSSQAVDNEEELIIAGLAWGAAEPEHWESAPQGARSVDLFDIKTDVSALLALAGHADGIDYVASEHRALRPGRTMRIDRDGQTVGWLGELHPRLARLQGLSNAPVLFELRADAALVAQLPVVRPVSRFPSVRRDLAVIVADEIPAGQLMSEARAAAGSLLTDILVFDVYTGSSIEKGLKSVALGLILQETSSTLTELEIDGVVDAVIARLSSKFNASIRE